MSAPDYTAAAMRAFLVALPPGHLAGRVGLQALDTLAGLDALDDTTDVAANMARLTVAFEDETKPLYSPSALDLVIRHWRVCYLAFKRHAEGDTNWPDAFLRRNWPEAGLLRHTIELRPGVSINLELPADLTAREADRLAGYISRQAA